MNINNLYMAIVPTSPSSLELSICVPGFSSSRSVRELDINEIPRSMGEEDDVEQKEWMRRASIEFEEEEEEIMINNDINGPTRKKLRLTKEQSRLLEESFRQHHTLNPKQKEGLALQLKLRPRQVEVWFQNRRARSKLKQTEMECEYLKRWFGSLREQNRRLQREVEELRAMKAHVNAMSPHTCEPTLSMCPRCQRVTPRD